MERGRERERVVKKKVNQENRKGLAYCSVIIKERKRIKKSEGNTMKHSRKNGRYKYIAPPARL